MLMANLSRFTAALLVGLLLSATPQAAAQAPGKPIMEDAAGDVTWVTAYSGPGAELVDILNVWAWIEGDSLKVEMELASLEDADTWTTVPRSSVFYIVQFSVNNTIWQVRANHQLLTGLFAEFYPWSYYFLPFDEPDQRIDLNGSVNINEGKWFAEVPLTLLGNLTGIPALTGLSAHAQMNQGDSSLVDTAVSEGVVLLPQPVVPSGNNSPEEPGEEKRNAPAAGIWAPVVALSLALVLGRKGMLR